MDDGVGTRQEAEGDVAGWPRGKSKGPRRPRRRWSRDGGNLCVATPSAVIKIDAAAAAAGAADLRHRVSPRFLTSTSGAARGVAGMSEKRLPFGFLAAGIGSVVPHARAVHRICGSVTETVSFLLLKIFSFSCPSSSFDRADFEQR